MRDSDDSYFNSYSYFEIHKDMLSDKTRTDAYRDALTKNPTLMNDANVIDVGCGTGILSMFAARDGGARNVVGVDGSYRIADVARMNVGANDLREKVEIIEGNSRIWILYAVHRSTLLSRNGWVTGYSSSPC